jgi:hypothetical protein
MMTALSLYSGRGEGEGSSIVMAFEKDPSSGFATFSPSTGRRPLDTSPSWEKADPLPPLQARIIDLRDKP